MIEGFKSRALSNNSRTRAAPTPTNNSTNCDPDTFKNGVPASPAIAFANNVLPVPGGPPNSTPFGTPAPNFENSSGSFKNLTTSFSSSLASSLPATSANLMLISVETETIFASKLVNSPNGSYESVVGSNIRLEIFPQIFSKMPKNLSLTNPKTINPVIIVIGVLIRDIQELVSSDNNKMNVFIFLILYNYIILLCQLILLGFTRLISILM